GLLTLVTCSKTSIVVAEAVVVLRQLLQQNPGFKGSETVVRRLAVLLTSLAKPAARASIVWTLSEYHEHISNIASDVLRVLAKAFPELEEEVKIQV
ncbi:unnamed protein product, partial [Sphacelaria rigidula]